MNCWANCLHMSNLSSNGIILSSQSMWFRANSLTKGPWIRVRASVILVRWERRVGTWWLRRKYLLSLSRNPSDFDWSPLKTVGSFPIGFTSRTAGGGAISAGIAGGRGPCPPGGPPGSPPGGDPGCVGGGVGEEGLNLPCKRDGRVNVSWSCVLVTILAIRNSLMRSWSGIGWSLNPSGSYSREVVDGIGKVMTFWGELLQVLMASFSPSSRSFRGSVYMWLKRLTPGAGVLSIGSRFLWRFTLYQLFWYRQIGVLFLMDSVSFRQKAK